jgi:uncharacterized protein (DUF2252 family)
MATGSTSSGDGGAKKASNRAAAKKPGGAQKVSAAKASAAKASPAKASPAKASKAAAASKQPAKKSPPPVGMSISQAQASFERTGSSRIPHKPRDERVAEGHLARAKVPPARLGDYTPMPDRPNAVDLILSQEESRLSRLLPVRHARMAQTPFTFYRGTAILMAQDLGAQPSPLIGAQIGGDAHISNFGFYAADDRRLVFDMNDFDETRPGPFEWDVKRYAVSVLLAARDNGIPDAYAQRAVLIFARRYAYWLREFANKPSIEVWYDRLDVQAWVDAMANVPEDQLENLIVSLEGGPIEGAPDFSLADVARSDAAARLAALDEAERAKKAKADKDNSGKAKDKGKGKAEKAKPEKPKEYKVKGKSKTISRAAALRSFYVTAGNTVIKRAAKKTGLKAVASLTAVDANGRRQFVDNPPLVERLGSTYTETDYNINGQAVVDSLRDIFRQYRASLSEEKRVLVDRFAFRDAALKVVGVGSVGTRAAVILFEGQGEQDPFILQIKEAGQSVLTPYIPKEFKAGNLPVAQQMGKRVVIGQKLMQATSDIFLGYVSGITGPEGYTVDYYIRQLKDMKLSFDVEAMDVATLMVNAILVARVLGHAHGRTGDPLVMASYIGTDDDFAMAILNYSIRYVEQVDADFAEFTAAVKSGRIEVSETVDG